MKSTKMSRLVTGVLLSGALTLGVVPAAGASVGTTSVSTAALTAPAPKPSVSAPGQSAGTTAVPLAVRVAVRAGMEVLKRTNVKWYKAIVAQVNKGRAAFVKWWDSSVPSWVKKTLGVGGAAIGGNAAYDALLWLLGLG